MKKRRPDADSAPASDEMLANLRPISEAPKRLQRAIRNFRGKQKAPTKRPVYLRLSPFVLDAYRGTGRGWQSRMNADLEKTAKKLRAGR